MASLTYYRIAQSMHWREKTLALTLADLMVDS